MEPPRTIRDIAIALAEGLATPEWTSPPVIVGIAGIDDDGFDLRVHPLVVEGETEAMHPADLLPLLDIPDDWLAVGAVAYGWVAPLDDAKPPVRPSGHPDAERARIVSIIDRAGNETAAIQRVTGRQHVIEVGADTAYDSTETGAIQDALRRALDLPTPPCQTSPIEFLAIQWLASALENSAGGSRRSRRAKRLNWDQLRSLHPTQVAIAKAGVPELYEVSLVRAGELSANVWDWTYLREEVTAGRCDWLDIHPDTAAWMDDGMFARTLLSMWPRLVDLRAEILRRLSPRTLERLDETLEAWGLAESAGITSIDESIVVEDDPGCGGRAQHRPGRRRQVEA